MALARPRDTNVDMARIVRTGEVEGAFGFTAELCLQLVRGFCRRRRNDIRPSNTKMKYMRKRANPKN
jgi:hypothetical protein